MRARYSAWLLIVVGIALVVGAALVSCTPDRSAPELSDAEMESADSLESAVSDEPTEAPPDIVTVDMDLIEPFTDQECLDCHSNQTLLIEITPEEEETESLSEGPG
ncbi:MAG: hypothetical protein GYB66_14535 [Chloroflexi bacterium]|nr:hypothetical protein [Chloroflexota bacterium]